MDSGLENMNAEQLRKLVLEKQNQLSDLEQTSRIQAKESEDQITLYKRAIDDFEITIPKMPNDPGVTAIISPSDSTQIGITQTVQITIKNFGIDTLFTIPVYYKLGANTPINENWTGILAPSAYAN